MHTHAPVEGVSSFCYPASMLILSIHAGIHDTSAALFDEYRVIGAIQKERLTRDKKAGGQAAQCIVEVLGSAGVRPREVAHVVYSRGEYPAYLFTVSHPLVRWRDHVRLMVGKERSRDVATAMMKSGKQRAEDVIDIRGLLAYSELPDVGVSFANHHFAHALPTLFFTDWQDALLYTADGAGDGVNYSHYVFKDGHISNLFGDDRWLHQPYRVESLARAYANATEAIGFRPLHHEGKVTGLAAFGEATLYDAIASHFSVDDDARVVSDFKTAGDMRTFILALCKGQPRENVAASIQDVVEDLIHDAVSRLLERTGVRHLGLAGGLFANVKLNRRLAERCTVDEVFVMPPMGDEGLVIGGALQYLLARDGLPAWLDRRYPLESVYWGRDHDGVRAVLDEDSRLVRVGDTDVERIAASLDEGAAVALFTGRMEYGPRALGARSILARPTDRSINDSLNKRLARTEFMPFAPVVAEEDAAQVFEVTPVNLYACRFMTITCAVREAWRARIPAVVHVDGTARPQVIARALNPTYYDILAAYKRRTGIPVLINTSFNAHEEPIINTPQEAADALAADRIDFLATGTGLYRRA